MVCLRILPIISVMFLLFFLPIAGFAQEAKKPLMWLSFDQINVNQELHIRTVEDQITKKLDTIVGRYAVLKDGVHGKSLLLDGYSSYLSSSDIPNFSGPFSIEAWIAIGAYPTNFCPIAEQMGITNKGFSLGINYEGKPGFKIATPTGWIVVEGNLKLPLLKWVHIGGVYDSKNIILYLNGEKIAQKEVDAFFVPAPNAIFYSGITSQKSVSEGTLSLKGTEAVYHFFDGLVDELKIWDQALTDEDFVSVRKEVSQIKVPALESRPLPKLSNLARFGAVYTNLRFYESWDNYWQLSGSADVVVSFDQLDGHFVFWRGTSYIPHWVSGNGIWYNTEFNETWSDRGCNEPMSDKRCEHSQVKIVENTAARCVVHWRYALIDNWYNKSNVDTLTGWGDWTDEIYTIYPDGVAVRSQTLHSRNLSSKFEWHEGIIVMGQDQGPEDVLFPDALIMANMNGEEHRYSWEAVGPDAYKEGVTYVINKKNIWLTELNGANIQLINTRSNLKPFTIINPDDQPKWDFFSGFFRRDYSIFPWWNHWPTSFKPSDGRYSMDKDRASHTSLTHVREWKSYKKTEYSETRLMLVGLTEEKVSDLVPLASSWSHPPEMIVHGKNIVGKGYEPEERAYQLECLKSSDCSKFAIELNCTPVHPAIRPAFVVSNWDKKELILRINGKKIADKNTFRHDLVNTVNGSKLILWINKQFEDTVNIEVSSQ